MATLCFGGLEFTPSLLPTIATIAVISLTCSLGNWQVNRAQEKRDLQRQYELVRSLPPIMLTGTEGATAQKLQFHRLMVEGEFDAAKQIFLDNQVSNGIAGYHVLTPLKLRNNSHYVMVNRGWIPRGTHYPSPPLVPVPVGLVTLKGYGALPVKRFLELSADTIHGSVWENVTFSRYEKVMGLSILPIILVQSVVDQPVLTPIKEQIDFGILKHQGYAFQWFALAVGVAVIYLFMNVRYLKNECKS